MEYVRRKNLLFSLLSLPFVGCYPINFNNSVIDSHTQYLTVLIAVILTICSVVLLTGCLCCQRRKGFKEFRDAPGVPLTESNLDHGHVNPIANGEFTIFKPLSPPYNNNTFVTNKQFLIANINDETDINYWFENSDKHFPRDKLKYISEIGKGWFGKVVEGVANDTKDSREWMPVVVRILEASATSQERLVFLHDVSIYNVGYHPNILKLFGHCLDTIPLLILQEFCSQGDLKKYLKENQIKRDKFLTSKYPLLWCCQLTSALKHLHDSGVIHPDLAARNCQLHDDLTLKLGDYGLAVFQYPADYYQGLPGVSVRWCAPETITCTNTTIQPKKITAESNVWSIGVTIWEIFECGKQPYSELSDDEVLSQVYSPTGLRLTRPSFQLIYTDYLYRLMQLCWLTVESRPLVNTINLMLNDLYQVQQNTDCINLEEFDKRWNCLKSNNTDTPINLNNINESVNNSILDSPKIGYTSMSSKNLNSGSEKGVISSQSSSSEDENWSNKVERGAYTEKVRQKSRSVTDLMVLTHINIDYSESENETSLPSLVSKKRLGGSEKNLVKSYDDFVTFEQELKNISIVPEVNVNSNVNTSSISKPVLFMQELSSPIDIQPPEQVFNVFNAITQFSPMESALQTDLENERNDQNYLPVTLEKAFQNNNLYHKNINNLKDYNMRRRNSDDIPLGFNLECLNENILDPKESEIESKHNENEEILFKVPKLYEIIQNNNKLVDYLILHYDEKLIENLCFNKLITKENETESKNIGKEEILYNVPKLYEIIQNNDTLVDYILTHYDEELVENTCFNKLNINENKIESKNTEKEEIFFKVPKLFEIILNNDTLVDYILAHYDEKLVENLTKPDRNNESVENNITMENNICHNKNYNQNTAESKYINEYSDTSNLNFDYSLDKNTDEDCSTSIDEQLNYSLETWDNFLGKTMDIRISENFEHFNTDSETTTVDFSSNNQNEFQTYDNHTMFNLEGNYVVDDNDAFAMNPENEQDDKDEQFKSKGWFLHPRDLDKNNSNIKKEENTYVGFRIDEEIMAAIRNELINKLPHAQGNLSDNMKNDMDLKHTDQDLFIYNRITNGSLSPILEEDETELNEYSKYNDNTDINACEDIKINLRTINFGKGIISNVEKNTDDSKFNEKLENKNEPTEKDSLLYQENHKAIKNNLEMFLNMERNNVLPKIEVTMEINQNNLDSKCSEKSITEDELNYQHFINRHAVPLPSPEDHQWKQLITFNEKLKTISPKTDFIILEHEKNYCSDALLTNNELTENDQSTILSDASHDDIDNNTFIISNNSDEEENELFENVFSDIRFIGPADNQLMSTSFSESNELNDIDMNEDEQDWDSISENKSSSSGEFIWQGNMQENDFTEKVQEGDDETDDEDLDEEYENKEFVPSAWDKYAAPIKSVLKSPERTLSKSEKKSKGVWFKKQKHYCIYEYPREPDSPILYCEDFGQFSSDFNLDGNFHQIITNVDKTVFNNSGTTFDINACSQFFPSAIFSENITPDSGIDDTNESCTPDDSLNNLASLWEVKSLKELALDELKNKNVLGVKKEIGGLRHTRNKLKLDLQPIPSTFSVLPNKTFSKDTNEHLVSELGQKQSISTFGKNRFIVQQVYTPPSDETLQKDVSFEALPHKPKDELKNNYKKEVNRVKINSLTKHISLDNLNLNKGHVESVEGEAILLEKSEDSGIGKNSLI